MKKLKIFGGFITIIILILVMFVANMFREMKIQMNNTDPKYWQSEVDKIISDNPPENVDIVLYGSSSPRMWPEYETDFSDYKIVNTSFGGSKVNDNIYYYQELVEEYDPEVIIYWGGTNNINGSEVSQTGKETFEEFKKLHYEIINDGREMIFIPINPTKSRANQWQEANQYNNLVKEYAKSNENLEYIDLTNELSGEEEVYNEEYLRFDGLHLNELGYQIVKDMVIPVVNEKLN